MAPKVEVGGGDKFKVKVDKVESQKNTVKSKNQDFGSAFWSLKQSSNVTIHDFKANQFIFWVIILIKIWYEHSTKPHAGARPLKKVSKIRVTTSKIKSKN